MINYQRLSETLSEKEIEKLVENLLKYMDKKENPNRYSSKNRSSLKRRGLTVEKYNEMLESQNGVCAICKKEESVLDYTSGKIKNLSIDHDHKTGKNRGLLCTRHNTGLGYFQDSLEMLENAINYLKKYNNDFQV